MVRNLTFVATLFVLLLFSILSSAQKKDGASVHTGMLVSTEWLGAHLNDPDVVILHVANSAYDYKRGHIPGAHYLSFTKLVVSVGQLSAELPPVADLQKLFSEAGVGNNTRVVIYTTLPAITVAARAFYTLDYLGHGDQAALLDGGIEQWLAEGRQISTASAQSAAFLFTPHVDDKVRAQIAEAQMTLAKDAQQQALDARPSERYSAGHLAGAANLYWQDTLIGGDRPLLRSPEQLRELYAARGIVPGKKIVTYCEIGIQASHAYFVAKYLGYNVALYDGSYQEWTANKLPVVTGQTKR